MVMGTLTDTVDIETQSIPTMVRDWLTMTFTRSLTNLRLRQDRLHFRSVANAIRAGIVVDRSAYSRRVGGVTGILVNTGSITISL